MTENVPIYAYLQFLWGMFALNAPNLIYNHKLHETPSPYETCPVNLLFHHAASST